MSRGSICVVGTMVIDLVAYTDRRPEPGETVLGNGYEITPGGKGFNQAVAARRAGADVTMVGAVGDDGFGRALLDALDGENISSDYVRVIPHLPTGAGFPVVIPGGGNTIVIVPGAGAGIDEAHLTTLGIDFTHFDMVAMQLELAPGVALSVARQCRAVGTPVLLNPAPARKVTADLLALVDVLAPNQIEAEAISGISDPEAAAKHLAEDVPRVVVTCGPRGAVAAEKGTTTWFPAPHIDSGVDTVGAGDVFCGYLAAGLTLGHSFDRAVADGVAAATDSVTRKGSALSAPHRDNLERPGEAPESPKNPTVTTSGEEVIWPIPKTMRRRPK